jgi:hypothetical protein
MFFMWVHSFADKLDSSGEKHETAIFDTLVMCFIFEGTKLTSYAVTEKKSGV